jgi:hypothetical protein
MGFDFPIGLPQRYARACGIEAFLDWLSGVGSGAWADFYRVAERPQEIGLRRPFYPLRPGRARQAHLLQALGVERMDDLRRACELPRPGRRAAAPLFWTLGGQQVGKAAIKGWQEVIALALGQRGTAMQVRVWPFSGELHHLLRPGATVLAETYPTEFYDHLGVRFRGGGAGGKRSQAARAANAPVLLAWAEAAGVELEAGLRRAIEAGFGPAPEGEDAFDAVVGAMGMVNVVLGRREPGEPQEAHLRRVEGWILGQRLSSQTGA